MSKIKNYPLASAARRIGSGLCDYIFIILINVGITIGLTFFTLDASLTKVLPDKAWLFSLMFVTSNIIFVFIWWIYFVQMSIWTKGRTLFYKIFKLRMYYEDKEKIYRRIFAHEFMSISGICFANILISLVSFSFDDPLLFITNTFSMNSIKGVGNGIEIASSVMITVYVLSCFPLIGVVVNTAMNSNTTTLLDENNKIYVIHLLTNNKVTDKIEKNKIHTLPGDIDLEELEKIV